PDFNRSRIVCFVRFARSLPLTVAAARVLHLIRLNLPGWSFCALQPWELSDSSWATIAPNSRLASGILWIEKRARARRLHSRRCGRLPLMCNFELRTACLSCRCRNKPIHTGGSNVSDNDEDGSSVEMGVGKTKAALCAHRAGCRP